MHYQWQQESLDIFKGLKFGAPDSIANQENERGVNGHEPVMIIMDSLIRYAKAYRKCRDAQLASEAHLVDYFSEILNGTHRLLDWNGAIAMERGTSCDPKDNGVVEAMFWKACEIAGIDGNML